MKANAITTIRRRRLYRTSFKDIDILAVKSLDPKEFFTALCEEIESPDTLPPTFKETTNTQRLARWLLLQAYEYLCGLNVPEPLLELEVFEVVCDLVDAYHERSNPTPPPLEPKRSKTVYESEIYFVQAEGVPSVKIGVSAADVSKRMASLQTGCPVPLKLLARCPGDSKTERSLHARFSYLRERGEWFRLEPELQSFIDGLATKSD